MTLGHRLLMSPQQQFLVFKSLARQYLALLLQFRQLSPRLLHLLCIFVVVLQRTPSLLLLTTHLQHAFLLHLERPHLSLQRTNRVLLFDHGRLVPNILVLLLQTKNLVPQLHYTNLLLLSLQSMNLINPLQLRLQIQSILLLSTALR